MLPKITYQQYVDKVLGGWLGKFIGGTIGGPVEGQRKIHNFTYYQEIPTEAAYNDDTDFQLVWLKVMQEKGIYIDSEDLMEAWMKYITYPWCEYGYAMENFKKGIMPPDSGWFNNDFFMECMGCPIRSEIWGFVCPGNPALAAQYAQQDGVLDHALNSVWAEMFLAAIEASAFFESDPKKLLEIGLNEIPEDCRLAECINDVMEWCEEYDNWKYTRQLIVDKYGSPDPTYSLQNQGFIAMALLYANNDFEKVILLTVNSGYDTDCTCATAGAIVGVAIGAEAIPARWKDPIHDDFVMGWGIVNLDRVNKLSELTKETCEVGVAIAKTRNKEVEITDVPQDIRKIKADIPRVDYELDIDYCGKPSIHVGEEKQLALIVCNNTLDPLRGKVTVNLPPQLQMDGVSCPIDIPAEDCGRLEFSVTMAEDSEEISPVNKIEAVLTHNDETLASLTFGLSGAPVWAVLGPFNNDDGQGLDEAYLPEPNVDFDTHPDPDKEPLFERKLVIFPEYNMDLDSVFEIRGPLVIYLVRYINSPEQRKARFRIASDDGFKVWLNGEKLISKHIHRFPMPYNDMVEVTLRKGLNKILIKTCRCSNQCEFRFYITDLKDHGLVDVTTVIPK